MIQTQTPANIATGTPQTRSIRRKLLSGGLVLFILANAIYCLSYWPAAKIVWASVIHNRREHLVDCEHLPFFPQVQKAFSVHQDLTAKVLAINGVAGFEPEQLTCKIYDQGLEFIKGDVLLTYRSRAARAAAERLLGQNFFGIPYRGQPVK
ncbi:MAG: hypothetical protein KGJ93_03770 [Patescibacteria group bacterium]|nr:hypothetical protein [Patescibacteria group bacterium]